MGKSLGYRCCVESRHGNSSCKSATVVMTNQLSQRDGASPRAGRGLFTLPYLCHFSSRSHSCSLTGQMWAAHTCGRFHVPHSLMIRHTESVCVCMGARCCAALGWVGSARILWLWGEWCHPCGVGHPAPLPGNRSGAPLSMCNMGLTQTPHLCKKTPRQMSAMVVHPFHHFHQSLTSSLICLPVHCFCQVGTHC